MATVNQLIKKSRKPKVKKTDVPALNSCPQDEEFAQGFTPQLQKNQILLYVKYVECA